MALDELYLENLDEFVNDENKVVTYKWLSKTLAIHVNQAKQMLYGFVQQQRNEKNIEDLGVTYLLSGVVSTGSHEGVHVQLVPEETLDAAKTKFSSIASCHVYSVQRTKLKDTSAIFTADYDLMKEQLLHSNKYSAIKCLHAKLRSDGDLDKMMHAGPHISDAKTKAAPAPRSQPEAKPAAPPSKKPTGIASMFVKAASQQKDKNLALAPAAAGHEREGKEAERNGTEEQSHNSTKDKKKDGVTSFFAKQSKKPTGQKQPAPCDTKTSETQPSAAPEAKPQTNSAAEKHTSGKQPREERKKKAPADDDDSVSPRQDKKRRRIKERVFESSSDDEMELESPIPSPVPPDPEPDLEGVSRMPDSPPSDFVPDTDEDEELPPTADDSQALRPDKVTTSASTGDGRRRVRKRKMISKMFVNDEGFMETEKVWEECSTDASESEEFKAPASKQVKITHKQDLGKEKKSPTKKPSPNRNAAGKQQRSLTSFFKKK